MLGVPVLNYVFYSTKTFKNTTMEILEDLGKNLGASQWYQVQSSYMAKDGTPMTPALRFGASVVVDEGDACWSGRALGDTTAAAIIACLIKVGRLAYSTNSLTLVLTGPDVSQGSRSTASFCAGYCGWHSTQVSEEREFFFFPGGLGERVVVTIFFFQPQHHHFFFSFIIRFFHHQPTTTTVRRPGQALPLRLRRLVGALPDRVRPAERRVPQRQLRGGRDGEGESFEFFLFLVLLSFFFLSLLDDEKQRRRATRIENKRNDQRERMRRMRARAERCCCSTKRERKKKNSRSSSSKKKIQNRPPSSSTRSPRRRPTRASRPGSTAPARRTPTSARGSTARPGRQGSPTRPPSEKCPAPAATPTRSSGTGSLCSSSTGPTGPREGTATSSDLFFFFCFFLPALHWISSMLLMLKEKENERA